MPEPSSKACPDASAPASTFCFGIEEEYFLIHRSTRDLIRIEQPKLMAALKEALGDQVANEFLCSQIEISTPVCHSAQQARSELARLRRTIIEIAAGYDLSVIAASTHPFAQWSEQAVADQPRYHQIAHDLAGVGRRLNTCGMHVHVGIDDKEARIAVMNKARALLPLLLALSSSSPFWQGRNTGLKCFRLAVTDAQPRSGLPEAFANWADYESANAMLCRSGAIDDVTKIWWDIRPSSRFPTIELRITDVCPRLDDAVAIALLFVCICRMLCRAQPAEQRSDPLLLLNENRWRAQRYGIGGTLIDPRRQELVSCDTLIRELLADIAQDAHALDCAAEMKHVAAILAEGTSADRQIATFDGLRRSGLSGIDALKGVVDVLAQETSAD